MKFQARQTKEVFVYSTKHHDRKIHRSGKPQVIVDYNGTKFGVDMFDALQGRYAYQPQTRRWPLRLFMFFVDAAAVNAYVLCQPNTTRREFISKVADQLMKEQRDYQTTHNRNYMHEIWSKIDGLFEW